MKPLLVLSLLTVAAVVSAEELREETQAAWNRYVALTEARIESELSSREGFLVRDFLEPRAREEASAALDAGSVFTAKLRTPDEDGGSIEVSGGMVHHWVGSIFVPGVDSEDLVGWLQAYDDHHLYFDEVEDSRLLSRAGESFEIFLRLRRKKIVSVHYNTVHRVEYRRHAGGRVSSASRAIRIAELDDAGTPEEREKPEGGDRGFLWRLNSYWRFAPAPGGVVVECESVSLSRGVPFGLRWILGRYLDSVPRESLEATLVPIRDGSRTTLVQLSSFRSKSR